MVELASVRSEPLQNSPDAPLLSEYGVDFVSELAFLFVGHKDMDPAARAAIASAIAEVATKEGGKANAFLTKGFGGPMILAGEELEATVQDAYDSSGALIAAAAD
ncbi:hypothetical protein [Planktotalea sp.]|uniref:hypothetical protein n=1 Tax=Planktotalea sp. TaxID=2029877 RepID=UPI003D6B32AE